MAQDQYYSKWNSFEKTAVSELEEEEKKEAQEEDQKLGKNKFAMSAAEARDKEVHEKLKAAKVALDRRRAAEDSEKSEIANLTGETKSITADDLGGRRVVVVKNCNECLIEFPAALAPIIKIFIEGCTNCQFILRTRLITSHLELSHCRGGSLEVQAELHTVQVDLCEGLTVLFGEGLLQENKDMKIYHAGCRDLTILAYSPVTGEPLRSHADFIRDLAPVVLHESEEGSARGLADPRAEEIHFITQIKAGQLLTERAVQVGNRFVTAGEMDAESVAGAAVTARQLDEMKLEAGRQKLAGNQAFANAEYAQAAVHYTMAIDHENTARSDDEAPSDLVHVCYCNRAACWLKLGQHEKALQDCDQCLALNPDVTKAHFRRGLALHIQQRYPEALQALGRALELEDPKSKKSVQQIREAIQFAEVRLAAQMRAAQQL